MDKLLDLVKLELNKSKQLYSDEKIIFKGVECNSQKLELNNFHKFSLANNSQGICFVDGGNCDIISSNDFNLSLVRVAGCIFKNKKRTKTLRRDFLCLVTLKSKSNSQVNNLSNSSTTNSNLFYNVKLFDYSSLNMSDNDPSNILGSLNDLYLVNSIDFDYDLFSKATLDLEIHSIKSVIDLMRRSLELNLLKEFIEQHLSPFDIAVIDGSLYTPFEFEKKVMYELYESTLKNQILLCALSKTSNLITTYGRSIHSVLKNLISTHDFPFSSWFYSNIVELYDTNYQAELFFAKFHNKSKHIFKFEIFKKQNLVDFPKVFGTIASLSSDPIFLGYPYGLVVADDLARVTNNEIEILKVKFKHLVSELDTKDSENSSHGILDSIKF